MNPRAAINDLLPFQGSPFSLLGTSPNKLTYKRYLISIQADTAEKVGFEPTAPCGVTGFQDQLLKPLGHLSICFLFCCALTSDSLIVSLLFADVNNFLSFLKVVLRSFLKRRRRDLNPRVAINDLLPFQGSPFSHLGTSPSS